MSYIFALQILFPENIHLEDFSASILELEEIFLKNFPNIQYDFSEQEIIVYNPEFINNEHISFRDYMEEGKILKKFLIENQFADENTYKNFFTMKKIEIIQEEAPSIEKLDALIAEVDKNDPKLLDVLSQIQKIQKK